MGSIARIEEHAVAAWPATHAEQAGGWLLRHTPGVGKRRNNSALPSGAEVAVEVAEAFYRDRDIPVIVQISPAEEHAELDAALAGRGYRFDAPTLVLTAPVAEVAAADPVVVIGPELTPQWRAAYGNPAVSEHVLEHIAVTTGYASVTVDDEIAALGLFVVADGISGVFCMATDPRHRRKGYAESILRAGASWSAGQGADLLYLQVEEDNAAARALYGKVGFTHSHSYHYRVS
ncbi:GNAT family N-acetyltransferase [Actinoplanes sichuanensis]|uniref:GNAT family N-acetyltransferase n=1 Tax=Actinoplanes sichuanensis TaxID=512349 RepID=A0ABW4ASV8_9ACTN|nr:GNAT family N-acetyltransferase [Actinoplanes sichuanensis]BEL07096.1 GNAT family N-acetyltransferase [Actinoplanes sichuanensis]